MLNERAFLIPLQLHIVLAPDYKIAWYAIIMKILQQYSKWQGKGVPLLK